MNKFGYFLQFTLFVLYCTLLAIIALFVANIGNSAETDITASVQWNNDNIHTSQHPRPVTIQQTEQGFIVPLEDGSVLYAERITEEFMEFRLGYATWWVYKDLFIWGTNNVGKEPSADTQIQAFSIAMFNNI